MRLGRHCRLLPFIVNVSSFSHPLMLKFCSQSYSEPSFAAGRRVHMPQGLYKTFARQIRQLGLEKSICIAHPPEILQGAAVNSALRHVRKILPHVDKTKKLKKRKKGEEQ